jgi:hypothetical protein
MIEVFKQALEALEANDQLINGNGNKGGLVYCMDGYYSDCFDVDPINKQTDEAIAAIKKALAQQEQEPVALPCCGYTDASAVKWNPLNGVVQCHNCGQTYTTPQRTWVGLAEEEIKPCWSEACQTDLELTSQLVVYFAKAIEAKLKQKNG